MGGRDVEKPFITKARKDESTKKKIEKFRVFKISCFRDGFKVFHLEPWVP